MSSLRRTLAAALLLTATPAAWAADLYSPLAQSTDGSQVACAIVNTSASPITVSAAIRSYTTGSDITSTNLCPASPATLAPGAACYASTDKVGTHAGYCHFKTSSSRVRANVLVIGPVGEVQSMLAATK